MKNSKRGFVVPFIIIAVLLIVGGAYYFLKNNSSISNQATHVVPVNQNTNKSTPSTFQAQSSQSVTWQATMVGGQLSDKDKSDIVAGTMNMMDVMKSGDVNTFRKFASIVISPDQLVKLQNASDSQLLAVMKMASDLMSKVVTPENLESSKATWTIKDPNHIQIDIQDNSNNSNISNNYKLTLQAMKENGVWY